VVAIAKSSKAKPNGAQAPQRKTMFEIEKYTKPTNWANVALWIVSVAALVVVALDIFYWRA